MRATADARAKARINVAIQRMEEGNFGDSKSVGAGVIEARIDYGPGYRVFYVRRGRTLVILLLCGDKSTQQKDIVKAAELAASL